MLNVRIVLRNGGGLSCTAEDALPLGVGDACIVETEHTLEFGTIQEIAEGGTSGVRDRRWGQVLRVATEEDLARAAELAELEAQALLRFRERARRLRLRPLSARYSFCRKRVTLVFSAEEQVDFRKLVYQLQRELGLHVEMRQVGVRDEAGILGGMGPCGREICCARWLRHFRSVNVRMAKAQELSLNPNAISGMCGRLKCCLRYEYDQYREAAAHQPRDGTRISWADQEGVIVGRDVLSGRLAVRTTDNRIVHVNVSEVTVIKSGGNSQRNADEGEHDHARDSSAEWTESEHAGTA